MKFRLLAVVAALCLSTTNLSHGLAEPPQSTRVPGATASAHMSFQSPSNRLGSAYDNAGNYSAGSFETITVQP